ncbi:MAG: hypothetical protein RIR39_1662, partial [Pseudomonadota bacterium]
WESLCDNCGKCCLHKLEDEDSGAIVFTSVACKLINLTTCRCTRYNERTQLVPECLNLKQNDFTQYHWLPSTCAYRLLNENKDLPAWHPLVSGSSASVKKAGVSIRSYAIKESMAVNLEDHVIEWLD